MIRFACPSCGMAVSAPEECAGRSTKCRGCNNPIVVPSAVAIREAPSPVIPGPLSALSPSLPRTEPVTREGTPKPRRAAEMVARFFALVLALAILGSAGWLMWMIPRPLLEPREQPLQGKEQPVSLAQGSPEPLQPEAGGPRMDASPRPDAPNLIPAPVSLRHSPPLDRPETPTPSSLDQPALPKPPPLPPKQKVPEKALTEPKTEKTSQAQSASLPPTQKQIPTSPQPQLPVEGNNQVASNSPPSSAPFVLKRRDRLSAEELRQHLLLIPEVRLDAIPQTGATLRNVAKELRERGGVYPGPVLVGAERPDITTLPLRMGLDCQLGKEPAETLQALSRKLRGHLEASIPKSGTDPRPNAEELRKRLLGGEGEKPEWISPDAVPALLQLLQAENAPVRKVLVEVLGKIQDRRATSALAMRSMVDLSPEVREAAILELRRRPCEDYRPLLLAGLRYPWLPVIAHAAESLVAVMDKGAVPQLVALLEAPHPAAPFTIPIGRKQVTVIRELVRINHLSNCMLCHAPSFDRADLVRGAVPTPGKPLPAPITTPQYYDRGGEFVRADITYLRQDFSVIQPVPEAGVWPSHQRFDYLVRVRRPTSKELKFLDKHRDKLTDEPRELLLFTLRELTGKDLGSTTAAWKKLLLEGTVTRSREGSETAADRDWKQFQSVAVLERSVIRDRTVERLKEELLQAPPARQGEILRRLRDGKGDEYTEALADAIGRLSGEAKNDTRQALVERLAKCTSTTLLAYLGSETAELRRAAALAVAVKEDKSLTYRLIQLLSDPEERVAHVAHAALKSLSGEDFGPAKEATREERAKAVAAWKAWWRKQTGR